MTISRTEFEMMQMRVEAGKRVKSPKVEIVDAFEGLESELHDKIAEDLRARRWYFVRSRMDKRTTQKKGVPDFIVAGISHSNYDNEPVTHWIEVKRKGEKLSTDQNIAKHCLLALGHRWHCVYSFNDYLRAIGEL